MSRIQIEHLKEKSGFGKEFLQILHSLRRLLFVSKYSVSRTQLSNLPAPPISCPVHLSTRLVINLRRLHLCLSSYSSRSLSASGNRTSTSNCDFGAISSDSFFSILNAANIEFSTLNFFALMDNKFKVKLLDVTIQIIYSQSKFVGTVRWSEW